MDKNLLRKVLISGIFLIPFIALVNISVLAFPFVTGKAFIFRIIIELLAGIWILLLIADKKYRPRLNWLTGSVLAFVIIICLADIFGANPLKSFMGTFERMDGFINLIHMVVYFIIVSTVIDTPKLWERLFSTTIGVSVILSLLGLVQLAGGMHISTVDGRLDSTLGNATYFAMYLLFHIFLALYISITKSSGKMRYVYAATALLNTIVLYFTATRGAVLGLIIGILVTATLWIIFAREQTREQKSLRKIAISIIVALFVIIIGFILVRNQPFVQNNKILNRFNAISVQAFKDQTRYSLWSMALQGVKERPLLGWGQENFNLLSDKYYTPALYNSETYFDRAHNIILDWLTQGGVLGLIAYLSIYVAAIYYIWSKKNNAWSATEKSILTGLIVGYFVTNMFSFDTITSYILFFTLLAYIYSETRSHDAIALVTPTVKSEIKKDRKKESERRGVIGILVLPIIVIALCIVYFLNVAGLSAAYYFKQAYFSGGDLKPDYIGQMTKALNHDSFGNEEIRRHISTDVISYYTSPNSNADSKRILFAFASGEMTKQTTVTPADAYNLFLLGDLSFTYGKYDKALTVLEKARALSPMRQRVLSKIADVYIAKQDYKDAYDIAKMSCDLEPRYAIASTTYDRAKDLYESNAGVTSVK